MNEELSWQDKLDQALAECHGKSLAEIFTDGPRKLFVERVERGHTFRLFIARPFGVKAGAVRRWRIQLTVQPAGSDRQVPLNDGTVMAPIDDLEDVIQEAASQLDEHVTASQEAIALARQAAMAVVPVRGDA